MQSGDYLAQQIEDRPQKQEDQLDHKQGVIEAVCAVSTVEEASQLFLKFISIHTCMSFMAKALSPRRYDARNGECLIEMAQL